MTDLDTRTDERASRSSLPLSGPRLPRIAPLIVLAVAAGVAALLWLADVASVVQALALAWVVVVVALPVWSRVVEGRRRAVDRFAAVMVWTAFLLALTPLISLMVEVIRKGLPIWSAQFFTYDMRGVLGAGGGVYHALMGTLIITLLAAVLSVPVGVMAAVYLVEYGAGNRLARAITFLVDVMTGIPSIVAGLFAYGLFSLIFDPSIRFGFGGAVALSVLMVPIVVRATEEMLKLVPDELREASYALGVSKWRTIVKVVLPTALGGIVTGITLSISRVIGETAPLLIIVGTTTNLNFNPFDGRMQTLPVFIYSSVTQGGKYAQENLDRAWGAALLLVVIVMLLNLVARVIGKAFSPKTGR